MESSSKLEKIVSDLNDVLDFYQLTLEDGDVIGLLSYEILGHYKFDKLSGHEQLTIFDVSSNTYNKMRAAVKDLGYNIAVSYKDKD